MIWWWKRHDLTTARLIRAEGALIDVSPLREKLGAAWSQYGPPVHRIAERMISQEIAGEGTFARRGDVYELTFKGSRRRARREAVRIAEKLDVTLGGGGREQQAPRESLGGPLPEPAPLVPVNVPASVYVPVLANVPPTNVPAPTNVSAINVRAPNVPASAHVPVSAHVPASINVLAPNVQVARDSVALAASAATTELAAPGDTAKSTRHSRAMERAAAQIAWQRDHATGSVVFPPPDLRIDFRPFWEIKSKHVTMYGGVPTSKWGGHVHEGYTNILPRSYGAAETLALDRMLLSESIAALEASNHPQQRALAITSLHAMTIEDTAASSEFIECCKSIPEGLRSRLLFEIIAIDRLLGSAESYGKIVRLAKFGRGVLGRTSVKSTNMSLCKAIHLLAVGFDLGDDVRTEGTLISDLETFAVIAARSKLESYARGLDSVSLTIAAVGAGIGYIEGMSLKGQDRDNVLKILPFSINDLYGLPTAR